MHPLLQYTRAYNTAHRISDVPFEMKRRVIEVAKHIMKTGKTKPQWKIDEQKPSHLGLVSLVQPTTQTEQETSLTMISTNERAF